MSTFLVESYIYSLTFYRDSANVLILKFTEKSVNNFHVTVNSVQTELVDFMVRIERNICNVKRMS